MGDNTIIQFDPLTPEFINNAYPVYHQLQEMAPVYYSEQLGIWFVTRYHDVVALLKDSRLTSRLAISELQVPAFFQPLIGSLLNFQRNVMIGIDGEQHTRLKGLIHQAFKPRVVEQLRAYTQAVTDCLIDALIPKGSFELISEFALPLPVILIGKLMGVPELDHHKLQEWSAMLVGGLDIGAQLPDLLKANTALASFEAYFNQLIEEHQQQPQDEEDFLGALIHAEESGHKLDRNELIITCMTLLAAGHETVKDHIANGMYALLRNPDQWALLKQNPSLVPSAVEELLRFTPSINLLARTALEDITIHDQTILKGQQVFLSLAAANHDPSVFPDPDRLDITRNSRNHLAFGYGAHFCLGAPLARLEGQIVFETVARRMPTLELATDNIEYHQALIVQSLKALPVRLVN